MVRGPTGGGHATAVGAAGAHGRCPEGPHVPVGGRCVFKQQPNAIWCIQSTKTSINKTLTPPPLSTLLHKGPWDGLWARKGYDPRTDPEARAYQAVHYQVPAAWQSGIEVAQAALTAQPLTDKVHEWPGLPPLGVHPGPVSE